MTSSRMVVLVTLSFLVLTSFNARTAEGGPVFLGLGDLPGGRYYSQAWAVSADGTTVVGTSGSPEGDGAFRWTLSEGMIGLGRLPDAGSYVAGDVSGDGSVIVGISITGQGSVAFRWTAEGGLLPLSGAPTGTTLLSAVGTSADGSLVIGIGEFNGRREAFRWTEATGPGGLGVLPGTERSSASGISADGSVIVGSSPTGNDDTEAFRWTSETGMIGLGFLPGQRRSNASAISADGNVIVGRTESEVFRWTAEEGMVGLGVEFYPSDTSGDGSIIVGTLGGEMPDAVIWDPESGLRDLLTVLESQYGLDLGDWTLLGASDISLDGTVLTGYGINPDGRTEAWIAVIPEPRTLVLLTLGAAAIASRRGRGGV